LLDEYNLMLRTVVAVVQLLLDGIRGHSEHHCHHGDADN
jgi:hypothetical protein